MNDELLSLWADTLSDGREFRAVCSRDRRIRARVFVPGLIINVRLVLLIGIQKMSKIDFGFEQRF